MKKIAVSLLCLMTLVGCGKQDRWVKLHEKKDEIYYGDNQSLNREKHTAWVKIEYLNDSFKYSGKIVTASLLKVNADCENGKIKFEDARVTYKDGKKDSVPDIDTKPFNVAPESGGESVHKWICLNEVKDFK